MASAELIDGTHSRENGSIERYGNSKYLIDLNLSGKDKSRLSIRISRSDGNVKPYFYDGDTSPHTYANLEEALADVKDGVPLGGGRVLDLAEISAVLLESESAPSGIQIIDPRTWEPVNWVP
ncbi:hypothetical protein Lsed01_01438 [Demequina sediminis]|uniref:Uncharacterized protein n=1 Tax=Demequina sediminis TaxID=1930058 RepID=A0ABP9WIH1_9MICO|nr:hypothetical protein [Demequina sediminis]BDZ62799.1 hypothetical protein GCM10025873_25900 [Demequina sediminis]